jgi:hypothetical protein
MRTLVSMRAAVCAAALAASVVLPGCTAGRVYPQAHEVERRFMGAPATEALKALGPPTREQQVADLRSYWWETGQAGELGGTCRLRLVADPRGTVVDYSIDGTPLGCDRILNRVLKSGGYLPLPPESLPVDRS